jgi:hypothetical protein
MSWCASLFGLQGSKELGSQSTHYPVSVMNLLTASLIHNVTSSEAELVSRHQEFHRAMASRHGSSNAKLYWHFMSGASVNVPSIEKNILFERAFYSIDPGRGHRAIVDKSFLIYTPWSEDWSAPLDFPRFLEVNETAGSIYFDDLNKGARVMEGPEDPRVIYDEDSGTFNFNFNVQTPKGDRQMFKQVMRLESHLENDFAYGDEGSLEKLDLVKTEPLVQFYHFKGHREAAEKNWVPILIQGKLHYFYSLSPLRIMRCDGFSDVSEPRDETEDVSGYRNECQVMFKGPLVTQGRQTSGLRCGTNWLEFSPGLFFSFARTRVTNRKCPGYAIYRPNLVLMRFDIDSETGEYYDPRVVYVSDPITKFDDILFGAYASMGLAGGNRCDDRAVLTPGSISRLKEVDGGYDVDLTISVNDDMSFVIRLEGIDRAIHQALEKEPSLKKSRKLDKKSTFAHNSAKVMQKMVERDLAPSKPKGKGKK